jgi:hypothetical protein
MSSFEHWFDPPAFYAEGYPPKISSALKVHPEIRATLQSLVVRINPGRALEIGPGDRPVIGSVRRAVYVDLVPRFLKPLEGMRVVADARRLPFRPNSFDLVVLADVLTHVPPPERDHVLRQALPLAPRIVIVNPFDAAPQVEGSEVSTVAILGLLRREKFAVDRGDYVVPRPEGSFRVAVMDAKRLGG